MKNRPPLSFVAVFCGAWVLLLAHLSGLWWSHPQYGYGLLAPFLCGWLLWQRRGELAEARAAVTSENPATRCETPSAGGISSPAKCSRLARMLLIAGAIMLLPLELLRQVSPQLRSIGIIGTALCLGLTFWSLRLAGFRRIPGVIFGAMILFLTAVPWPVALEVIVTQWLMKEIAQMTATCLTLAGVLAVARGNLIELTSGVVSIDEACSGVRSLQSCLMASVALGQFLGLRRVRAFLLVIFGTGLALAGNLVRTLALSLLAAVRGPSSLWLLHDPAGWTILFLVTVALYMTARRWSETTTDGSAMAESRRDFFKDIHWCDLPRLRATCVLGVSCIAAAHLWFWARERAATGVNEPFLAVVSTPELALEDIAVPDAILKELQPQRGAYHHGFSPVWGDVMVYTFFWPPGSNHLLGFYHRPDICMGGAGWTLIGEMDDMTVPIGGRDTIWRIFRFQREDRHVLQAWGFWRDGHEQKVMFGRGWRGLFAQQMERWHYIRNGRRDANTEIVSVVMDGQRADAQTLQKMVQRMFTVNPKWRGAFERQTLSRQGH